ncbi:helix-turn-helix domain-containing protein [Erythrobacter aurantius]|uniref:helix-turn-helix domain-containing protein n=1 Tax=Erythrobacter aurantius TaxID=2909249 RepID=UPI00207B0062|nr:helix-turn-helix transcriptional regulator [Erythrobacter aurantius]
MHTNPVNLRRAREAAGMSLDDLAHKAQVDRQTIYRIETQRQKKRRIRVVTQLASALGLSSADLCGPDLELEIKERAEPRIEEKAQMNVRVSESTRNSFALLALRYEATHSQVVEIAPFLFMWAAERSLQMRQERVQQFREAQPMMAEAVPDYLGYAASVDDRLIDVEEHSIANNDIFGLEFEDEVMDFQKHEPNFWSVPFAIVLRSMLSDMPDDTRFEDWELEESPRFEICRSDALEWLDGDSEAADDFLGGRVPLRDIPNDILKGDGAARAEWIKEAADRRRTRLTAARDAYFASLDDETKKRLATIMGKGEHA